MYEHIMWGAFKDTSTAFSNMDDTDSVVEKSWHTWIRSFWEIKINHGCFSNGKCIELIFLAIFNTRADTMSIDYIETKKMAIMSECLKKSACSHDCNKMKKINENCRKKYWQIQKAGK